MTANVNMSKVVKWLGKSSEIPDDEYGAGEFWIFQLRGSETCGVRMTLLNHEGITHISYTNQIMNLKKTQFLSWCRLQLGFTVQIVMCHLHRFEQRSAMAEQLFQFTSSQINPHNSDTGINIIEQQNHWNKIRNMNH